MSRKALFLYTLLGLLAFTGTLVIVAPPLAIVPFGFAVIFLPFLFLSLLLEWAFPRIGRLTRWLSVVMAVVIFMSMGSLLAAISAGILTIAVYTFKKTPPKPEPAKTLENAQYEFQGMGYRVSYSPVEQAARYTP